MEKKKSKKTIIIIAVVVIILLAIIIGKVTTKEEVEPEFETAAIEKRTLTTNISSTGKVTTETSKNVTSQLVNYKLTGVNVKVGDKVNVGDVLCTFDTATLAKTVSDLSATINAGNVTGDITVASADRAVQDAQRSRDSALDELNKNVQFLKQDFENNEAALNTARANLQSNQEQIKNLEAQVPGLTAAVNSAKFARDKAANFYNKKEEEYQKAQSAFDAAQNDPTQLQVVGNLKETLTGALNARNEAKDDLTVKEGTLAGEQSKLNEVTGKINSLNGEIASLNQQIQVAEPTVNAKREAYTSAQNSYNNQSATLNNQVANAQGQAESARVQKNVSNLTVQEQLTVYQKQLEETNLKATVSGTVTAVNAKAGDYYTGGALLVIEGAESFIVETEIDEYDISDVKVGMEVVIKTDATRDEELQGTVISVAPAASGSTGANSAASAMSGMSGMSAMGATSSSATYTVKVAINTQNDRLRLGMNAKLNIITQKSADVLSVPYDAINENEDGTKYVTVLGADNSERKITVTTGLESGYYTEVSSDKLKEGMKVKLPKVESGSTVDELLNSMGATAGM